MDAIAQVHQSSVHCRPMCPEQRRDGSVVIDLLSFSIIAMKSRHDLKGNGEPHPDVCKPPYGSSRGSRANGVVREKSRAAKV